MVSHLQSRQPEPVVGRPRPAGRAQLGGWAAGLAAVGVLLYFRAEFVPWLLMWLTVGVLLGWIKLLMLLRLGAGRKRLTAPRLLGFLFLWPGTRPEPFLHPAPEPVMGWCCLLLTGLFHVATGCLVLWLGVPLLAGSWPAWAVAWLGMAGLSLVAHFGLFDLVAAAWRAAGVPAERLFETPVGATSLADFWGNRWNRAFSGFARELILRPLARRVGPRAAGLAVFLVSGLVHELVITVPAGGGYGGPTLYFLIQGLLARAEAAGPIRSVLRRRPALGRLWTLLAVLGPAPLLFPPPFLHNVVLPFLAALGTGAPAGS
jgi:alginate O-acetyltransferase complex protein AlgI